MTPQLMQIINDIISAEETMRLMELHECAQSHMTGLQGFKRFHRYNSMDRAKHSMMIRSYMTEYHHAEPDISISFETPKQSPSMIDSIKNMYDRSKAHISNLSAASKMAFDEGDDVMAGMLMELIEDETKEAERYYRIWLDVRRENADLNYLSNELHKKYKHKERKYFNYKE